MNWLHHLMPLLQAAPVDSLFDFDLGETVDKITHTPFQTLLENTGAWMWQFTLKLIGCFALIWLGKRTIGTLARFLRRTIDRRKVDRTVTHFLLNLLKVFCWLVILWILVAILGINTSSIVAIFASAGLAFGLALSGTLQNFAGGIMILLFKPFRTGDYIASQGEEGTVDEITIINTILITPDNRTVYLPNGATFTGIVRNTSQQSTRRVEWLFNIGYGHDYDEAKKLLERLITADSRTLKAPAPFIALNRLNQSSVEIVVRVWAKADDYWGVFYDLNEVVYRNFQIHGLDQPSPQMDVYLHPVPEQAPPSPASDTADVPTEFIHSTHHCDAASKPSGGESGGK